MATIWYDDDADLATLRGKTVTVIGYGSQGHAHAQNLRDSGIRTIVGLKKGSPRWAKAEADGLEVRETAAAARAGDIIMILAPDEFQQAIYENDILPDLGAGKYLAFGHGFNIRYGLVKPPKNVSVFLIAPKAPGHLVRRMYVDGKGVPMLIAVEQDPTKDTLQVGLAYAKAIGGTRAGVIKTTFKEETETDLFGEQAVLCGGLSALVQKGFKTLVDAGYQPEVAYFECCHEMKLIVDMVNEGGLAWMRYSISDTAEYGDYTRGNKVVGKESEKAMKKILADVRSGAFAKEWVKEARGGKKKFHAMRKKEAVSRLEKVGGNLRKMMTWLKGGIQR